MFAVVIKIRVLKSYHERLLSTDFTWDKNSLSVAAMVSDVHCLKDKIMVREPICKTKNGKTVRPSGLLPVMVKSTREVEMKILN